MEWRTREEVLVNSAWGRVSVACTREHAHPPRHNAEAHHSACCLQDLTFFIYFILCVLIYAIYLFLFRYVNWQGVVGTARCSCWRECVSKQRIFHLSFHWVGFFCATYIHSYFAAVWRCSSSLQLPEHPDQRASLARGGEWLWVRILVAPTDDDNSILIILAECLYCIYIHTHTYIYIYIYIYSKTSLYRPTMGPTSGGQFREVVGLRSYNIIIGDLLGPKYSKLYI